MHESSVASLQGHCESNHLLDDVPEDLNPAEEEVTTEQLVADKQQVRRTHENGLFPAVTGSGLAGLEVA
jgi:hypothetical protein